MTMITIPVGLDFDEPIPWPMPCKKLAPKLESVEGDLCLDLSSVRRIDASALRALAELADIADGKAANFVLRDVNVDVYKVLKLVKLTSRFSFLT